MTITYAILSAALGLALSSSYITGALAANPHYLGSPSTCTSVVSGNTATLSCTGATVAGLGNAVTAQISGTATLTFSCATSEQHTSSSISVQSDHGKTQFPGGSLSATGSGGCTPQLTSATWSNVVINFFDQNSKFLGSVPATVA